MHLFFFNHLDTFHGLCIQSCFHSVHMHTITKQTIPPLGFRNNPTSLGHKWVFLSLGYVIQTQARPPNGLGINISFPSHLDPNTCSPNPSLSLSLCLSSLKCSPFPFLLGPRPLLKHLDGSVSSHPLPKHIGPCTYPHARGRIGASISL